MEKAQIIRRGILDCQACVPEDWDDERVLRFVEAENPCGTTNGWAIRREGDERLIGAHERVPCAEHFGFVHVMLDA